MTKDSLVSWSTLPTHGRVYHSGTQTRELPTLASLCLRCLESSIGKGLATLTLQDLPLGLAETIYNYVFNHGSRMAQMEISKALAPLLRNNVIGLDCSDEETGSLGDSALLQLTAGCSTGLKHLDLSGSHLITNDGIVGSLARCPSLMVLSLSGCQRVTDEVAYLIPHRTACLTELNLVGLDGITAAGIGYIAFLPALEKLCLSRCSQVGDGALVALTSGNCHKSLRWLDLTGAAVSEACTSSFCKMETLEYLSLSSTCVPVPVVASLARNLRLAVSLPDAPKTHARSNRTLLMAFDWSRRQSKFARGRTPARSRPYARPSRYGHGTTRCRWEGNPVKILRLQGVPGRDASAAARAQVKIDFNVEGTLQEGGRELAMRVVDGIVRLWPAVPMR